MKNYSTWIFTALLLFAGFKGIAQNKLLQVPSQYAHIAEAVQQANAGDTIIIYPGNYTEKNIKIDKAIIISSQWKLTGDKNIIDKTCVNADGGTLFKIHAEGVEISGLKITNGNHAIEVYKKSTVKYNHVTNDKADGISLESGSGGYIAYNLIENAGDDGIDIDIGEDSKNIGSNVLVEYNTIIHSHDDGMEIRLFSSPHQNIHYEIRNNIFWGSKNDGIQLISYDVNTGKVFNIHRNIFRECNAALGCMADFNTVENLNGAPKMDERVYFFNNTVIENNIAVTGGNNIIAVNNIIYNNKLGGFKRFGKNSIIVNNLFFKNNNADFIEVNTSVIKKGNIFHKDPLVDKNTFIPGSKSPCIDKGIKKLVLKDKMLLVVSPDMYSGHAPDLGAVEVKSNYPGSPLR